MVNWRRDIGRAEQSAEIRRIRGARFGGAAALNVENPRIHNGLLAVRSALTWGIPEYSL